MRDPAIVAIMAKMKKNMGKSEDEAEDEGEAEGGMGAEDILSAIESSDAEALASALKAFVKSC